jgi:hypothetical protein
LGAEAYGGAQFDFPTAGGTVQEKKICAGGLAVVDVGSPVTVVCEAIGFGNMKLAGTRQTLQ